MHFIQPTQIWLSFRAKNLRVTSHETLLFFDILQETISSSMVTGILS